MEEKEKKLTIRGIFDRLRQKMNDDDILGNAAQVAFYFSFALFPLLLFLVTLIGIILSDDDHLREELFAILGQVMPASAFELVRSTITEVTSSASSGKLTLGIFLTLWSASAGVDNMRGTLNEVYNLKETRSWFVAKATSLALTVGLGILILGTLVVVVYGSQFLASVLPIESPYVLEGFELLFVLAMLLLAFALLYNFAPNHSPLQWKWITPGAVIGVLLWIVLSTAFRIYLYYFDSYAATYGSLGAMIILLLWLYLTALVILIGGAINAIMDEKSGVEKKTEDPKQVAEETSETGKNATT
jgi:membrane protein